MPAVPSGEVTFVFTDIEGSTALFHELDEQYLEVLAHHNALLRDVWAAHDGVEVKTEGDAFFVAFSASADAIRAAVAGQRALATAEWPHGRPVRVRMGMHTGTAVVVEGSDYVGLDVHRAARVAGAAHGGQVLLTDTTARELPDGIGVHDLGEHRLKDFPTAQRLLQLTAEGLETAFPPPRTSTARSHNLPRPPTRIVGRSHELESVQRAVVGDARLVTLTGTGGLGKTRLALEVAWSVLGWYREGAWFVDLAGAGEAAAIPAVTAQALGLVERAGATTMDLVVERCSAGPILLVLDNLEQLLDDGITVISDLLSRCPDLTVLATSRERLRLRGEHEIVLDGLPGGEAEALFTARAVAADAGFTVTPDVALICQALDGIPLALELAAARVRDRTTAELLDELSHALDLLTEGDRDLPARQRTMRAAVAWSWQLCDPDEQAALRTLAVFAGAAEPEAIEAVHGSSVADVLERLADKSMAVRRGDRFALLVPIRAFVTEQTDDSSELETRHASYFASLAETAAPHLVAEDQVEWLDRLDADADNLHLAVRRNPPPAALAMAVALVRWWVRRGRWSTGSGLLSEVLEASGPDARALAGAAELVILQGDPDAALALLNQADEVADTQVVAGRLELLRGQALRTKGDLDAAGDHYNRATEWAEAAGDDRLMALAATNLGEVFYHRATLAVAHESAISEASRANLTAAHDAWRRAQASARRVGDRHLSLRVTLNLSAAAMLGGRWDDAREELLAARAVAQELGDLSAVGQADASLGRLAMQVDEDDEAEQRLASALSIAEELGDLATQGEVLYMSSIHLREGRDLNDNIACCRRSIALAEKLGDAAQTDLRRQVLSALLEQRAHAQP